MRPACWKPLYAVIPLFVLGCSNNGQSNGDSGTDSDSNTDSADPAGGSLLFAATFGGDEYVEDIDAYLYADRTLDIASAPDGGFYVTGGFPDTAVFGRGSENEIVLKTIDRQTGTETAQFSGDMYLLKYSKTYQLEWAVRGGGISGQFSNPTFDFGINVEALSDGSALVVGHCESEAAVFQGTNGKQITLNCEEKAATFAARYSPSGELLFAKLLGNIGCYPAQNTGAPCFSDATSSGGFVVWGLIPRGGITMDPYGDEPMELPFPNETDYGGVLSSWDSEGNLQWATLVGPTLRFTPTQVEVDDADNIFISLYFPEGNGTLTFGAGTTNEKTIPTSDSAIAKFDKEGNFEWVARTYYLRGLSPIEGGGVAAVCDGIFVEPASGPRVELGAATHAVRLDSSGVLSSHSPLENPYGGFEIMAFEVFADGTMAAAGFARPEALSHDPRSSPYCLEQIEGAGLSCNAAWIGYFNSNGSPIWRSLGAVSTGMGHRAWSLASLSEERLGILGIIKKPWTEDDLPDNVFGAGEKNETVLDDIIGQADGFVAVYQR